MDRGQPQKRQHRPHRRQEVPVPEEAPAAVLPEVPEIVPQGILEIILKEEEKEALLLIQQKNLIWMM